MDEKERVRKILADKKILLKEDYYLLYNLGLLGNRAVVWNTFDEFLNSRHSLVCIRSKKVGVNTRYNIPRENVESEMKEMMSEGCEPEDFKFNQSMPDSNLIFQGEIMITPLGLYILYSTLKKPMKQGLNEESLHAFGLRASMLLEHNLSPSSMADINALLELFPDSIIEFSTYSVSVGDLPGRNTIIWEVRNY
jgi:hypothetical protein